MLTLLLVVCVICRDFSQVRSNFESLLDIIDSEKNRTPRNALEDSDDDNSDSDNEEERGLRSSAHTYTHAPDWGDGSDAVLRSWLVALGLPESEATHCATLLHSSDNGRGGGYKSPLDLVGVELGHLEATLGHLQKTDIDTICAGVGALKTGGFDVLLRKLVESPRLCIPAEAAVRYMCLFKADG